MSKRDLFFLHAPYVEEDGTFEELFDVFMRHPQDNAEVIKTACEDISGYINFCMSISVRYYCEQRGKYTQYFPDKNTRNPEKWEMYIYTYQEKINSETADFSKCKYPDLEKMMRMYQFASRSWEELSGEEQERKRTYRVPYGFLFSCLLEGKTFETSSE